jgi:hypothetical protein
MRRCRSRPPGLTDVYTTGQGEYSSRPSVFCVAFLSPQVVFRMHAPCRAVSWLSVSFTLAGLAIGCAPANADDFHISNKLYFHPDEQPVESTTLFHTGKVYDFLKSPRETIIFDPARDQVLILDPDRRLKTSITTGEISTQIGRLREAGKQHKRPLISFTAAPKFSETLDPKTGTLKLASRWMSYEVKTRAPDNPKVARQYCDFADWLSQLNALLNPPTMPFPRLALNDVLRQRQELPSEITLTLMPEERRHKETVIRSEHNILMTLSRSDLQEIEEAHQQLHTFAEVGFDEYHRLKTEQASLDQASSR